ncbi:N-acetyltransferase family protein [Streptomyces qinglanensis]|uniref:GNAT family N-acetyltransferase n=1 Tax=Streptomyces qinglanensis TaxID=943816 RepID=UPI003D716138
MALPAAPGGVTTRTVRPEDYDAIIAVMDAWWDKPTGLLNRLHLDHFHGTSLIAEGAGGALTGFVVGFLSPSRTDEAHIHFTGVAPRRRTGLARSLHEQFFATARRNDHKVVKAIASPQNSRSIAFHTAKGFAYSEPVAGYDGPGQDRVVFARRL